MNLCRWLNVRGEPVQWYQKCRAGILSILCWALGVQILSGALLPYPFGPGPLCFCFFFSERLTMLFYLTWILFKTETALTHMVKKLCVTCAGVCAAMKVCPRKCSYKHVWMETEGKKMELTKNQGSRWTALQKGKTEVNSFVSKLCHLPQFSPVWVAWVYCH